MSPLRIAVVGGVAGGASAAARARRLSETAEITVFERGPHVSFANCGLPYHVAGVIADRRRLLVQTPESLRARFALDVRVESEVLRIDRAAKEVVVRERATGREYRHGYDALVLSPGAEPLRPPIPGIEHPLVRTLRNMEDLDAILEVLAGAPSLPVLVAGAGYIGLEMAEALRHRGLDVVLVERLPHVMGVADPEMVAPLHEELRRHDVELRLADLGGGVRAGGRCHRRPAVRRHAARLQPGRDGSRRASREPAGARGGARDRPHRRDPGRRADAQRAIRRSGPWATSSRCGTWCATSRR